MAAKGVKSYRLSESIAARLKAKADELGMRESEIVQLALARFLDESAFVSTAAVETAEGEGKRKPVRLSLNAAEYEALLKHAEAIGGVTPTRTALFILRAGLFRDPQFSADEIAVLRDSVYQMFALGRNINQIAKALNTSLHEDDLKAARGLTAMEAELRSFRLSVGALVDKSASRYGSGS